MCDKYMSWSLCIYQTNVSVVEENKKVKVNRKSKALHIEEWNILPLGTKQQTS
jgi:hypothetical protein